MKKFILSAIVAITGGAVFAAPRCDSTKNIHEYLSTEYGEHQVAIGVDGNGDLIEWWGNSDTGTWTIVASSASGNSCAVAAGGSFERVALAPNL